MHSLYAVGNAVSVSCRSCQRPIDIWLHHGLEIGRAGVTKHPEVARRVCLDCLLDTVSPEQRHSLMPKYELQRIAARESGIPAEVTTYVLGTEGSPSSWSGGYSAIGYAVHIREWDFSSGVRRHLTIVPDDPNERPFSLVFFAANVFHHEVKLAYLKIIWPFHDLSLPERCEVVNATDAALSDADASKILRGRRFWHTAIPRGRRVGTGNYAPGEEGLFLEALSRVLATHERVGVRIISMDMLADKTGMGRTTLFDMFRRAPGARERFRAHKRQPYQSL